MGSVARQAPLRRQSDFATAGPLRSTSAGHRYVPFSTRSARSRDTPSPAYWRGTSFADKTIGRRVDTEGLSVIIAPGISSSIRGLRDRRTLAVHPPVVERI